MVFAFKVGRNKGVCLHPKVVLITVCPYFQRRSPPLILTLTLKLTNLPLACLTVMATYHRVFYCRHRKAFSPGALCISGPTPLATIAKPVPFRSDSDSDSDHTSVAFSGQWTASLPCFSMSYSRALKSIPEVNGPLLLHLSKRTRIQHLELSGSDGSERKAFVAAALTNKENLRAKKRRVTSLPLGKQSSRGMSVHTPWLSVGAGHQRRRLQPAARRLAPHSMTLARAPVHRWSTVGLFLIPP